MKKAPDYYRILHVHPDADPEIIKSSYRTLMQKLKRHPDLGGNEAHAALINEAFATLIDAGKRALYDAGSGIVRRRRQTKHRPTSAPGYREINRQERTYCPFCKEVNFTRTSTPSRTDPLCSRCKSPLCFIDFDPEWVGRRGARRAKNNTSMDFMVHWESKRVYRGSVEDLSPTGMRFVSIQQLRMGDIIKIDTDEISAVASVLRCNKMGAFGWNTNGVKFLSLKVHNTCGTFISHKV